MDGPPSASRKQTTRQFTMRSYDTQEKFWAKQLGKISARSKKKSTDRSTILKLFEHLGYARYSPNFWFRRIRWVQQVVKYAHRHVFEITAFLGVSTCDEQEPCDDEVRLRPTANPRAHQIARDIQALSCVDNAVEFKKIHKGKMLNLWLDEDTKEHFLKLGGAEENTSSCQELQCGNNFETNRGLLTHRAQAHKERQTHSEQSSHYQCPLCRSIFW